MDKFSFAKGGIRGLKTPFLEFSPGKAFFVEYYNFFQYLQGTPISERMVVAWYDMICLLFVKVVIIGRWLIIQDKDLVALGFIPRHWPEKSKTKGGREDE